MNGYKGFFMEEGLRRAASAAPTSQDAPTMKKGVRRGAGAKVFDPLKPLGKKHGQKKTSEEGSHEHP